MKYTTNSKVAESVLPHRLQCVWQICPHELPRDMHNAFALEMFQMPEGRLVILQLFIPNDKREASDWFRYIEGYAVYGQIDGIPKPSPVDTFPWRAHTHDEEKGNGLTTIYSANGGAISDDMCRDTARSVVDVMNMIFSKEEQ